MSGISLHVPEYGELWYRQRLLADPDTMSYNKEYGGENGCIDFSEEKWRSWYGYWMAGTSDSFYAYIVLDGEFIGEVNLHKNCDIGFYEDWYDLGIVVESHYRGNGHAAKALDLLLETAFKKLGAASVHNEFENYRTAALRLHLNAGFFVDGEEGQVVRLSITAARYFQIKHLYQRTRRLCSCAF